MKVFAAMLFAFSVLGCIVCAQVGLGIQAAIFAVAAAINVVTLIDSD